MNQNAADAVTAGLVPTPDDWARYRTLVEAGTSADAPELLELCQRLAVDPADLELHKLALTEAARLQAIAAGGAAAQAEIDRVGAAWLELRQQRNEFLFGWQRQWDGLAVEKGQADSTLATCQHAAAALDSLEVFFPELFGRDPANLSGEIPALPAAILNVLNERRAHEKRPTRKENNHVCHKPARSESG